MTPVSNIRMESQYVPIVTFAKDQPEYLPLPAWRGEDGTVVTRWRLTWKERMQVLFGGHLWLTVLTFNRALQPVMLTTECPECVPFE